MSKRIVNLIGIITGLAIIVFSIIVFTANPTFDAPSTEAVKLVDTSNVVPAVERDLSYGGDAYTGMQQASAQAATNLVAVYDSINQSNANLETLNKNIITQGRKEAEHKKSLSSVIQTALGFLLLSLGLLTFIKHLGLLLDSPKKSNEASACTPDSFGISLNDDNTPSSFNDGYSPIARKPQTSMNDNSENRENPVETL